MGRRKVAEGYPAFKSIPRLHRDIIITEKIDGTNALISIERRQFGELMGDGVGDSDVIGLAFGDEEDSSGTPEYEYWLKAGSRTRWLHPGADNHGFGSWVSSNASSLIKDLGPGLHYGEWWGRGINRNYGLDHNRFSLFNTHKWSEKAEGFVTPYLECVPILHMGKADELNMLVNCSLNDLEWSGSLAAIGFMNPEGVVIYHDAAKAYFKVTLENDSGKAEPA